MRRPLALVAASAATLLLTLPSGQAGAAQRPAAIKFSLPPPGKVSVLAVRVTMRPERPGTLPRRVRIHVPQKRRLPADVRVLTATRYTRTRRKGTASILVVAIRKAGSPPRARAAQALDYAAKIVLGGVDGVRDCARCNLEYYEDQMEGDKCKHCARTEYEIKARRAADIAAAGDSLYEAIKEGVVSELFREEGEPPPKVDTGHYDDGHAFGWSVDTKAEEQKALLDLIGDIWTGRRDLIVPNLEVNIAVDLDGDGKIGPTDLVIDTTVGPPVVTGDPPPPPP